MIWPCRSKLQLFTVFSAVAIAVSRLASSMDEGLKSGAFVTVVAVEYVPIDWPAGMFSAWAMTCHPPLEHCWLMVSGVAGGCPGFDGGANTGMPTPAFARPCSTSGEIDDRSDGKPSTNVVMPSLKSVWTWPVTASAGQRG